MPRWMMLVFAVMATAACEKNPSTTPPAACSSKGVYSGGHGPEMAPGQPCLDCHGFAVAGTVMGASHDDDNCDGVTGVTVEITDANGAKTTFTTNAAGNFLADDHGGGASIAMPYTAKLIGPTGKTSQMSAAQSDGNCNSCHTAAGANGAPGRIVAPM